MPIKTIDYEATGVPAEYQKMVDRLRDFLDDTIEQNDLKGIEESTDLELYRALEDTWDDVNYAFDPVDLQVPSIKHIP